MSNDDPVWKETIGAAFGQHAGMDDEDFMVINTMLGLAFDARPDFLKQISVYIPKLVAMCIRAGITRNDLVSKIDAYFAFYERQEYVKRFKGEGNG